MTKRKCPFSTRIPFTVARLREEAARVKSLGLVQVQFTCETDPGLQAMVYGASGRIVFYSRYTFARRIRRTRIGELGLISVDQAKRQHLANRGLAAQGGDPRRPKVEAMTFGQLFRDHYLAQCQARQKKTIETDVSRHRNWIGPALGDLMVTELNKSHVHHLMLRMNAAGRSPATIKTTVGQVGAVMELAVELGIVARNPVKGMRTPRVDNRRTEFMTVDQVRALIAAAQASDDIVGSRKLMLQALTGARSGEASAAKWADISLDEGVWTLPTQKSGRRGKIHLSCAAKQVIQELMPLRVNEYLFPGAKGNPQRSRPIKLFRRLCEQAGIPPKKFRIHDLRHAWCSLGNLAGIPLEIISLGARHSSPTVTRIYSHAHESSLVAANEAIAELIMPPRAA